MKWNRFREKRSDGTKKILEGEEGGLGQKWDKSGAICKRRNAVGRKNTWPLYHICGGLKRPCKPHQGLFHPPGTKGWNKGERKILRRKLTLFLPIRLLRNDRFFSSPFVGLNYILFTRGAINISTYLISNFYIERRLWEGWIFLRKVGIYFYEWVVIGDEIILRSFFYYLLQIKIGIC